MPQDVILAIDQGTTNTKALLVDRSGAPIFRASAPVGLLYTQPGFVEQDADALWESVKQVIHACIATAQRDDLRVEGIAISNQRETALAWRPGANPRSATNAISWQCRRSSDICDRLQPSGSKIREVTGLPLDPLGSAGKWAWLMEHEPALHADAQRGELLLGTVDSWLLYNLTLGGAHATDHTNASRTGLYSLRDLAWSGELIALYGLPEKGLPSVQTSSSRFGVCVAIPELAGVPIVAMIGDSHAALVGHGGLRPGALKATYGTGSSLMMLTDGLLPDTASLARTIAWSDAEGVRFALEGNIAMTGSAVQWVGEFLGLAHPVEDVVALAASVPDAAGLSFVPAMVGLGAPYWDTHARGLIANLGRGHRAAHLARAAINAIAFQVADVLFSMEQACGLSIAAMRVDGGATRNDQLMQFQADIIQRTVARSGNEELSAIGAAWLGGLTSGWWPSAASFVTLPNSTKEFHPMMLSDASTQLYTAWQTAVERTQLTPAKAVL